VVSVAPRFPASPQLLVRLAPRRLLERRHTEPRSAPLLPGRAREVHVRSLHAGALEVRIGDPSWQFWTGPSDSGSEVFHGGPQGGAAGGKLKRRQGAETRFEAALDDAKVPVRRRMRPRLGRVRGERVAAARARAQWGWPRSVSPAGRLAVCPEAHRRSRSQTVSAPGRHHGNAGYGGSRAGAIGSGSMGRPRCARMRGQERETGVLAPQCPFRGRGCAAPATALTVNRRT